MIRCLFEVGQSLRIKGYVTEHGQNSIDKIILKLPILKKNVCQCTSLSLYSYYVTALTATEKTLICALKQTVRRSRGLPSPCGLEVSYSKPDL